MKRPAGYRKLTSGARRPMQLGFSRSSLRNEFCVMCFIGRSPTQELLCHNSTVKCKLFRKIFVNISLVTEATPYLQSNMPLPVPPPDDLRWMHGPGLHISPRPLGGSCDLDDAAG